MRKKTSSRLYAIAMQKLGKPKSMRIAPANKALQKFYEHLDDFVSERSLKDVLAHLYDYPNLLLSNKELAHSYFDALSSIVFTSGQISLMLVSLYELHAKIAKTIQR